MSRACASARHSARAAASKVTVKAYAGVPSGPEPRAGRNVRHMARFLSAEWIAQLDRAASGSPRLAEDLAGVTLVVERRVEGSPFGDVSYVTRVDAGQVRFVPGPADDADLVLLSDYETARALARGELNAQQAFAAGRLKIRGGLDTLVTHSRTLAAVGVGLDAVRSDTTFD